MDMEKQTSIKVALVRGDSLREQETRIWKELGVGFATTAFCARKNVFSLTNDVPVEQLSATSDSFLRKTFYKYAFGQYQRMFGLEQKLSDFDIAHTVEAFTYYTVQAVRAKQRNPKLKVVASFLDNTFGRFEYNYWPGFAMPPAYWRKRLNGYIQESLAGVDLFLPWSHYSAELLYDLGVAENKVRVVVPGLTKVAPSDAILSKYNLHTPFFLSVGRMVWEKGVYDVLYAWKQYIRRSNNAGARTLVMAGQGPELANIERLVREFDLVNSVRVYPSIPNQEVQQLCAHAEAFVLGSTPTRTWQEQFGLVLAEAILQGCPVISTTSGSIPEVVQNAGILVPASNPVALSQAMLVMDNSAARAELVAHCSIVGEQYTAAAYVQRLKTIYQSLV